MSISDQKGRSIGEVVAYEFYRGDEINGYRLIGILPERRNYKKRITKESIMKWVRILLDDHADMSNIFFLKITIEKAKLEDKGLVWNRRDERSRKLK